MLFGVCFLMMFIGQLPFGKLAKLAGILMLALVLFLALLKFTPAAITQYLPDRFVTWQGRLERFFDGHKDNLDESGTYKICLLYTSSNGKTTTTMLTYHILKEAGVDVGLAGNVGNSLALQVAEDPHAVYVIELSSFQLDNMYDFKADIAIILNITPDHLDRYNYEMQNYVDAKFRILQNQTKDDAFIFWNDDPIIAREIAKRHPEAPLYPFAETHENGDVYKSQE